MNCVTLLSSPVMAGQGIRVRDVSRGITWLQDITPLNPPAPNRPNAAMTARHCQKLVVFWYLSPKRMQNAFGKIGIGSL